MRMIMDKQLFNKHYEQSAERHHYYALASAVATKITKLGWPSAHEMQQTSKNH